MSLDVERRFVLLVEDEEIIRLVFERVFARHPEYLLDVAATVRDAIDKVDQMAYDLIFLDMKFEQDYSGLEVVRHLERMRQTRPMARHRVVIMSASINLQDVMSEAHSLGVLSFMHKPVPFNEEFLSGILQIVGLTILPRRTENGIRNDDPPVVPPGEPGATA